VPARLPADLLTRTAEEAARLLALAYLDEIDRAKRRLSDPLDTEALHDFRVGLRRLRSCTRAYRAHLKDSVSKKIRRRLRDLTAATNAGRDTEVQLGWLHQQAGLLGPGELEGLAWLIGRLEGRKLETLDAVTADVASRFSKASSKLRPRLRTFRAEVRMGLGRDPRSFGPVIGELIRSHSAALGETLRAMEGRQDAAEAHATRIAAKRLRYLLEPLVRRAPGVKRLIGRLKELQDVLGDLRDMQVLSQEIASSLALLSQGRPERTREAIAGLNALHRTVDQKTRACLADFHTKWGGNQANPFFRQIGELATSLIRADGSGVEVKPEPRRVSAEEVASHSVPVALEIGGPST
jgi:CHAD domain-containing protein